VLGLTRALWPVPRWAIVSGMEDAIPGGAREVLELAADVGSQSHPQAKRVAETLTTLVAEIANLKRQLEEREIKTRCPLCHGTIFVGKGGHLTCSTIGCKEPGIERQIADLKRRLADAPHRKNCAARCQYRLGLHPCGKIKCNHKPEARSACDCR